MRVARIVTFVFGACALAVAGMLFMVVPVAVDGGGCGTPLEWDEPGFLDSDEDGCSDAVAERAGFAGIFALVAVIAAVAGKWAFVDPGPGATPLEDPEATMRSGPPP